MGRLHFKIYSDNDSKTLKVSGHYVESLALLSNYVLVRRLGGKLEIKVRKFYQPLRDDEWLYYNESGDIYLKERYHSGILIEKILSK